ncbi:AarF/ABC1/UbiB kinase family protein [Prochlorococcus sp. MIT 0801]|uniref:ABC1 kinase family protein n=1 Tax=Prochlorococcus sp. MIT 0801 TaxID=1501269 RepID=UPI00056DA0BD|nr:AarF/ABC1/UbiB kinase family protein [Prochlorococcus sp. MIT 0801]
MKYDFKRDLTWLILRPWILVPRFIQIVGAISLLLARLIFQGSSNEDKTQKKLAKFLLKTLIDLGPCFIKVGQALSTRPDLIRKDWLEELTNLQDNLPSFSHEKALEIIENELGKPANELFEDFPSKPIASASLGQVYKAKLFSNYWVAVKVQRPNLIFNIRRDIVIIKILGVLSAPILPLNLGFGLGEIIDEFGRSLFDEIDYKKEANNAEKFSNLFHNNNSVTIPKVERHLSTIKVLTTSWIDGTKLKDRNELIQNHLNPSKLIRTGVISGIQQLLEFGYFHADPHPGNMFALEGHNGDLGNIAYVDFGMMDSISEVDRLTLTGAIVHLINNDFHSVAKDFQKLGFLSKDEDLKPLVPVLKEVLGSAIGKDVASFNFKEITNKFSELMFDYPFRVPARFALIIRAVISQEGLAIRLDPDFKIIDLAYPYVAKRLLTSDTNEMINILLDVIFDQNGHLRVERIENLFDVLVQDSSTPAKELIPVAGAGLKLLTSSRGSLIRKNLLMSIIKDERIDTKDMKQLIKLVRKTFNPLRMASGLRKQNKTQVA